MVYRNSQIKLPIGQMFWREAGDRDRPVLIFLHGNWHDSSQWQEIIEPLSKEFHCFALDLIGFGNSIAVKNPTSIADEVDGLQEFLTALKLRHVYLVGHSLGAWIAIDYTLKYPARIRGVVAISPEGFFLPNLHQYGRSTKLVLAHPWLFKSWVAGLQALNIVSDEAAPLQKRQAYWEFFKQFPTTCKILFQRSTQEISSELVADKLSQYRTPTLILQSDADDRSIVEQSQAYAQAIRDAEYQPILELGADSLQQSISQTVKEIQGFVERTQLRIDREEIQIW